MYRYLGINPFTKFLGHPSTFNYLDVNLKYVQLQGCSLDQIGNMLCRISRCFPPQQGGWRFRHQIIGPWKTSSQIKVDNHIQGGPRLSTYNWPFKPLKYRVITPVTHWFSAIYNCRGLYITPPKRTGLLDAPKVPTFKTKNPTTEKRDANNQVQAGKVLVVAESLAARKQWHLWCDCHSHLQVLRPPPVNCRVLVSFVVGRGNGVYRHIWSPWAWCGKLTLPMPAGKAPSFYIEEMYLGYGPFPVTVTTRIIPFLVGNPYKC